jgi:hypothetical protein
MAQLQGKLLIINVLSDRIIPVSRVLGNNLHSFTFSPGLVVGRIVSGMPVLQAESFQNAQIQFTRVGLKRVSRSRVHREFPAVECRLRQCHPCCSPSRWHHARPQPFEEERHRTSCQTRQVVAQVDNQSLP